MLNDDVFVYGDDDDDDDNHGKSDDNTNNTYKFRVSVIVTTVMLCHGDDEGDADGCRKCNGDRFGEGCCDSDDDVDCDCDGGVDVDGHGEGNGVGFGCGHGDRCGFMMNEFFRHDDIDLIPTIAMRDVFDADDESFMFFCHLDADDFFDAYASIPVCLH